jgi:hypothetical protein
MVGFDFGFARLCPACISKFRQRRARARSFLLLILLASLTISASTAPSSWALGSSNQPRNSTELSEQVVREALGNQFCEANLNVLAAGSALQPTNPKEAADDSFKCFRDPDLLKSLNYMERERRTIVKLCATADVDASARALALYHLGSLFRHAQDFYRGSNYVDLQVGELTGGGKEVTADMLYGMELVDWTSLLGILRNGERTKLKVEDASKGEPNSAEAKRLIGGVTYFSITRELSVRETQRQWKLLESLVRSQFKANAGTLLSSLQQAGVPKDVFDDVMKHGDAASF